MSEAEKELKKTYEFYLKEVEERLEKLKEKYLSQLKNL